MVDTNWNLFVKYARNQAQSSLPTLEFECVEDVSDKLNQKLWWYLGEQYSIDGEKCKHQTDVKEVAGQLNDSNKIKLSKFNLTGNIFDNFIIHYSLQQFGSVIVSNELLRLTKETQNNHLYLT